MSRTVLADMGTVAYFGESGASSRKDAVPQTHLVPCVKGEDTASDVPGRRNASVFMSVGT